MYMHVHAVVSVEANKLVLVCMRRSVYARMQVDIHIHALDKTHGGEMHKYQGHLAGTHTHVYTMHTHMYIHLYIYIHIYIYIYTHTHTYTYTYIAHQESAEGEVNNTEEHITHKMLTYTYICTHIHTYTYIYTAYQDSVEGEVNNREGHITHEGRHSSLVHSAADTVV